MKSMDITCGIYLYSTRMRKFLIGHATNSRGGWSIPKGLKDEGEDELTAAIRETEEETGVNIKELNVTAIHPLPHVRYRKQKKMLAPFLVITDSDLEHVQPVCRSLVNGKYPEIDRFKWVDLEEMGRTVHEAQAEHIERIKDILQNYDQ